MTYCHGSHTGDMKWEPGNLKAHMKFSFHPSGVGNYYCPVMHRVESALNFESLCLANPVLPAQELSFRTGNPEKERTLKDGEDCAQLQICCCWDQQKVVFASHIPEFTHGDSCLYLQW